MAISDTPTNNVSTGASSANDEAKFVDDEDEDQEYRGPDEHPANYPRPGHGLMRALPPEQEDLQWLVDDEDRFGVFSHVYQVDAQAANTAGVGLGESSVV